MLSPWLQILALIPQPCFEITKIWPSRTGVVNLYSCMGSSCFMTWMAPNDIIHVGVYSFISLLIFEIRCGTGCPYTPLNSMLGPIPFGLNVVILTRNYFREHRSWAQLLQGTKTGCGHVKRKKCIIMFCRKTSVMLLSSHITPYWHSSD